MSLMDLYKKTYGGAEKTAAAEGKSGEALLNELLGEKAAAAAVASPEEIKTAASYEELGRQLARESFATDVLGLDPESEKTAAVIAELLGEKPAEKVAAKAEEKTEEPKKEAAATEEDILVTLGLAEAPKKEAAAEKKPDPKEGEAKQAALNELAVRMAKSAKKGDEKSKAGLMMLKKKAEAGNEQSKVALAAAVTALKGGETKEAGALATFLAGKKKS